MSDVKKGIKRFQKFHAKAPTKIVKESVRIAGWPKALVFLGQGHAVEYKSDKLAHGERVQKLYRHKLGRAVNFYTDPDGQMLIIFGGKFRVTDWLRD
jgi:hypothetical protein